MRFGIAELRSLIERHRRMAWLVAGLFVLAGIDLLLFPPKGLVFEWLAVPFLGAALIAYPYVPATYRRERDFVATAMLFLLVVFVVPLLIARVFGRELGV